MVHASAPAGRGKVYLVGAGPGDPGLMTLRGVECLRRADVVLYDYLVNPRVLEHARGGAELICLGRHGHGRMLSQHEVSARMVAEARGGRCVVRLKGGDPIVFAHAGEEIAALSTAGIAFEIVPGVTTALAAGSYAGIPLTHRDAVSAVALVTGQCRTDCQSLRPGESASPGATGSANAKSSCATGSASAESTEDSASLDFAALAHFPGTLVVYMGVTSAPRWTGELIAGGKPPQTPAAIVRRCTWPDQTVVTCTLAEVPEEIARRKLRPPVIVIVGDVAAHRGAVDWFTRRPLFGTRVLVTRPIHQAAALRDPLEELGAEVLVQPAIEIGPPPDWGPVDAAIANLDRFDWLVFSSSNGVQYFLDRLLASGRRRPAEESSRHTPCAVTDQPAAARERHDLRRLGHLKLAAVGPGTADELAKYHLAADIVPEEFRAEALAAALTAQLGHPGEPRHSKRSEESRAKESAAASETLRSAEGHMIGPAQGDRVGRRFLLVRASRGREVLAEELTAAGAQVTQVVAYRSLDAPPPSDDVRQLLTAGRIDWVTVTSSAIARSLVTMFGDDLGNAKLVSISPVTSQTLREVGHMPAAEAKEYTMPGVVQAILEAASGE